MELKNGTDKVGNNKIKTFTNYEDLLKQPDIDAGIIGLPTHLHLQCAKQAAEAKKHIF